MDRTAKKEQHGGSEHDEWNYVGAEPEAEMIQLCDSMGERRRGRRHDRDERSDREDGEDDSHDIGGGPAIKQRLRDIVLDMRSAISP